MCPALLCHLVVVVVVVVVVVYYYYCCPLIHPAINPSTHPPTNLSTHTCMLCSFLTRSHPEDLCDPFGAPVPAHKTYWVEVPLRWVSCWMVRQKVLRELWGVGSQPNKGMQARSMPMASSDTEPPPFPPITIRIEGDEQITLSIFMNDSSTCTRWHLT